ncbi:MAG: hypothetical protein K8R58_13485 [Bacteroidales bacterium]|nr:hypothetical protein [Bacteroidales bacterium]
MVTFLIIAFSLLVIISWILFAPLVICINSSKNLYYINLTGICKARFIIKEKTLYLKMKIFFISFMFEPLKFMDKKKIKVKKKKKKKQKKIFIKQIYLIIKFVLKIIKCFKIKKLNINIDTHNYYINSLLIPVTYIVNSPNVESSVNFNGINNVVIILESRTYKILMNLIKIFRK